MIPGSPLKEHLSTLQVDFLEDTVQNPTESSRDAISGEIALHRLKADDYRFRASIEKVELMEI